MEFKNDDLLEILASKTGDLHDRINEKINQNRLSFCSYCLNHGRDCAVAESSLEKMIAIRDSLKDVHNIILFLQKVKSRQKNERDEALGNLEESRKKLIERVNEYPEKGRKIDVLEELMTTFAKDYGKMDENKKNVHSGISSFFVKITRFGLEFVVIFASIYYASAKWSRQKNNMLDSSVCLDVLCGRG